MAPGSLVCEAVIAETSHLVAKEGVPRAKVVEFILRARLTPVSLATELRAIETLLQRYADGPVDFADACVVRLAELHDALPVCTLDRHFRFFRKHADQPIPLLAPFAA